MRHDIAYAKSAKLEDRHAADYTLQEDAWKRFKADDSGLGEKANAWFVTTAMRAKRALGAGVSQPKYTPYPANLDDVDMAKLSKAVATKKGLVLTFRCNRTKESISGDTRIPLTAKQIRGVVSSHAKNKDAKVRITTAQLKSANSVEGGFLPALLAATPAIAAAITGGISAYNNKKANDKLVEERIRHNKAMEALTANAGAKGDGVYIGKKPASGDGVYINKKPTRGEGARCRKKGVVGNGLYQELLKKKKSL
ncbi:unnamed protein product [Brugia timori]|uniref:Uncharacterized protein n=1 Tax=Brugia timori TaxID=42155 RepID=A0A0R3Q549_9BILA|nr:unnamed protein product [Brugia timori]